MSAFRLLDVSQAQALGLTAPDFYFSPAYGHACECSDGGPWRLALWKDAAILYPFHVRAIPGGDGASDLSSPYGYPGLWADPSLPPEEWRAFRAAFRAWARSSGAVAEFVRFSGLVPGREAALAADPELQGREHNLTVAVDTSAGYEAAWNAFESRARTKVRKARNLGFTAHWRRATEADVLPGGAFRDLYDHTMRRIGASPYYFFSDAYHRRFVTGLEVHLLEVRSADARIAAAALALPWGELSHLHLVGTEDGANRQGVGPFIYDEAVRWAAERGHRRLHIGGGMKPGDSLFYFKSGFGGLTQPYWIAQSVLDPVRYEALAARRADALGLPLDALRGTGYFPTYRSPPPAPPADPT
jgi:GNAT superfamily N-acetyltransferase